MDDLINAIERIGFPTAIVVFGGWFVLLPLRDAGLKFVATLENFLTMAGRDIHDLKSSTSLIMKSFETTQETVKDTNRKVRNLTETQTKDGDN
jgi:hypothetical protein